jgi:SAM-dependent methyltransferase
MREGRNSSVHSVDKTDLEDLQKKLMHVSGLAGLFYPLDTTDAATLFRGANTESLPVPPESFRHGYGSTDEEYLAGGRYHAQIFNKCYEKYASPLQPGQRMLDFGCSGGRVIRFFEDQARQGVEVWGCDIDSASIDWSQKNLMPPFKFFTNTTTPHLPCPDGHFSFVYAGSVFSHMNELTGIWLMELARCTAPGGICLFTIHSELTLDYIMQFESQPEHRYAKTARVLKSWGLSREALIERGSMCFESSAWFLSAWFSTEYFTRLANLGYEVIDVLPDFYGYQTCMVLRKAY